MDCAVHHVLKHKFLFQLNTFFLNTSLGKRFPARICSLHLRTLYGFPLIKLPLRLAALTCEYIWEHAGSAEPVRSSFVLWEKGHRILLQNLGQGYLLWAPRPIFKFYANAFLAFMFQETSFVSSTNLRGNNFCNLVGDFSLRGRGNEAQC